MEGNQKVLKLAVSVGETLLLSGGEIYRVQETVERILEAYGMEDYHVFVVSNGIFATVDEERESRGSMVRNVPLGSVHLGRIAAVNQLSREICSHSCSVEEAYQRLRACQELPEPGWLTKSLAAGMGCAAFGYIFGGRFVECLLSFCLGLLLQIFLMQAGRIKMSKFMVNILGSAAVTAVSFALSALGMEFMQDKVVIGSIVLLVPGVVLTTGIRELFNGDYLSGSIHLADALMTAACIAVGVGAAVKLIQLLGGAGL
ncbi:MAG: threonine/serine exporter family protein [Lachnospiraceae bacterium]|jgi:uncharacterized membrane protein YjjP (DUF1212 family)|nr:threonine/serine exporter family protein [Lachnospiraceae bacterium]